MTDRNLREEWQSDVAHGHTTLGLIDWIDYNIDICTGDQDDTPSLDTSFHDHEMDVD